MLKKVLLVTVAALVLASVVWAGSARTMTDKDLKRLDTTPPSFSGNGGTPPPSSGNVTAPAVTDKPVVANTPDKDSREGSTDAETAEKVCKATVAEKFPGAEIVSFKLDSETPIEDGASKGRSKFRFRVDFKVKGKINRSKCYAHPTGAGKKWTVNVSITDAS